MTPPIRQLAIIDSHFRKDHVDTDASWTLTAGPHSFTVCWNCPDTSGLDALFNFSRAGRFLAEGT